MNMRKKLKSISALCGAALLTLTIAGCGQQNAQADYIGLDAAKAIALENAGISESAASFSTTGLDRQNGTDFYTIDFTANGQSYAYSIDALTGNILSGAPESASTGSGASATITAQQAQEIALNHTGLTADQVTFLRCALDNEDGRQVYDVEFYNSSNYTEYDYEIDIFSGDILSYDFDVENYVRPTQDAGSTTTGAPTTGDTSTGNTNSGNTNSGNTNSGSSGSSNTGSSGSSGNSSSGSSNTGSSGNSSSGSTSITADRAKQIALNHAGLTSSQVSFIRSHLDWENGRRVYEVEFYNTSNYTEYDYEIDASTGTILSYDHDAEYYTRPSTGNSGNSGSTSITADRAKQIALNHAGLTSSQVSFIRSHLDWDDGRQVYEVEFYNTSNYTEYDYEIDASTGTILSYDHDAEYYTRPSTGNSGNSGATITLEQAKQIALAKVPGATNILIHLDRDDGRLEYEGSIYYGSWEYEFTIDAYTGAIREWERDSIYD